MPWEKLLYRPAFDGGPQKRFTMADTRWIEVAIALGLSSPWIAERLRWNWTQARRRKQRCLRSRLLGHEPFAQAAWAGSFGAAPETWPTGLGKAFQWGENPLQEPPTPYETAAFLLGNGEIWRGRKGDDRPTGEQKSCLLWWLVGIPAPVMEQVAPGWEEEAEYSLRWLFQNTPRFTLWALGLDLRMIAPNREDLRRILVPHANHQKYLKMMVEKPISQHILISGQRLCPAPRILPNPVPLWAPLIEGVGNTRPSEWDWPRLHRRRLHGYRHTAWDILKRYEKTGIQF